MKGLAKFIAIITGLVVIFIIAAVILVKTLVTPERVKETVLPIANKALHREVTLSDVSISIFSGIELKGLKIMSKEGDRPFVSCQAARLHYDLLPLLHGKVQVGEVTIVSPEIHVIRNSDGSFNFSDLLEHKDDQGKGRTADTGLVAVAHAAENVSEKNNPAPSPAPAENTEKADGSLAIAVSNINISDGKVIFTDHAAPGGKVVETTLSDLDLKVNDFSLTDPFPIKLETMLNQGSIKAEGSLNIKGPDADMRVEISGLSITDFAPYFAASLPGKLDSARFQSDVNVKFSAGVIKSSGNLQVENISFTPSDLPEASLKNVSTTLDYDIIFNAQKGTVTINSSKLDLNGIKVNAKGHVSGLNTQPVLALDISLPEQSRGDMVNALPAVYAAKAKKFKPEGTIAATISAQGKASNGAKLLKQASLIFNNVTVNAQGIPAGINGSITLAGDTVKSSGLALSLDNSVIDTELVAEKIYSKPVVVKTKMTSQEIDLDAILAKMEKEAKPETESGNKAVQAEKAEAGSASGAKGKGTGQSGAASEPAPLNIPVNASGSVYVALLKYHNVPMRDVRLNYTLRNNKLHITQTAMVAEGKVEKNVNVDLGVKGYRYDGDFKVSSVLVQKVLSYASPSMSKAVSGILDLKGNFKGAGIAASDIKKNLWLKGDWTLLNGQLANTGVVSGLISFLGLNSYLKNIDIQNAAGDFIVEAGKVLFKGKFTSSNIDLAPEGTVSLDGDMNIHLNSVLSPELASKIPAGQFVAPAKDDRGWSKLPLMVTGTWSSPRITLDKGAVTQQATRFLTDKLFGSPDKKDDKGTAAEGKDTDTKQKAPEKQLLENTLKGLFGN